MLPECGLYRPGRTKTGLSGRSRNDVSGGNSGKCGGFAARAQSNKKILFYSKELGKPPHLPLSPSFLLKKEAYMISMRAAPCNQRMSDELQALLLSFFSINPATDSFICLHAI